MNRTDVINKIKIFFAFFKNDVNLTSLMGSPQPVMFINKIVKISSVVYSILENTVNEHP